MENTDQRSRFADAFNRLILVIVFLLIFFIAARTALEPDLWWHLRAGEVTLQTGHPLLTDTFSYTRAGQPWVNHSWLSEIILYLVFRAGGAYALSLLTGLIAATSMMFVWMQTDAPNWQRAGVILLASIPASMVWSPRPQLFSLLMFGILGWILYQHHRGKTRMKWWLPLLFLVWSNLHGGFALGFILLGCYVTADFLNRVFKIFTEISSNWKEFIWLVGICFLCGFAVLLNPNGIKTWLIPFSTVGVKSLQQFISEWASPDFHELVQQSLLWLGGLLIFVFALSRKQATAYSIITILIFGYMALLARRNYGPFAMVCAPVILNHLPGLLEEAKAHLAFKFLARPSENWMKRRQSQKALPGGVQVGFNISIVAILMAAVVLKAYLVNYPAIYAVYASKMFPQEAVLYLQQNKPEGQLFSEYNWGGYLIWNLREYPVFVDGRTDLFGDEVIGQWINVIQADEGWQQILDQYQVRTIMLSPQRKIIEILAINGWKLVYRDDQAVIYER